MASRATPPTKTKAAGAGAAAPTTTRTPTERSETYEERQRRYNAARVLESNEMLIWWSTVRNESTPQTRLHFENQLAGFASDDSEPEWDDDPSGGPPPAGTPGVHVRFLLGENSVDNNNNSKRGPAGMDADFQQLGVGGGVGAGGVPDMVPLDGGERVERRRPGSGTAEAAQSGSGSGNNSPAGKGSGKKGRRSMGGG